MRDAALAVGAVTQTTGLFLAVVPRVTELRRTSPGTQTAAEVRTAERFAVALAVGTGAAMGALSKSSAPVYAALITTAVMVAATEYVLRKHPAPTLRLVNDGETVHTEGIPRND